MKDVIYRFQSWQVVIDVFIGEHGDTPGNEIELLCDMAHAFFSDGRISHKTFITIYWTEIRHIRENHMSIFVV